MWFGSKPSVRNLRAFGEVAIIKTEERKVSGPRDERGKRAIFVGYTNKFNTYRFLIEGKIHFKCDAAFINRMNTGEKVQAP